MAFAQAIPLIRRVFDLFGVIAIKARAIRAQQFTIGADIQEYPGMSKQVVAGIAGDSPLGGMDDFRRFCHFCRPRHDLATSPTETTPNPALAHDTLRAGVFNAAKRFAAVAVTVAMLGLAACAPVVQVPLGLDELARLERYHAVMTDGARLPITRWLPEREPVAALVALHGFNDHSGAFSELGPKLAESGIAVYAYDQRGFGGAPGRGIWAGTRAMGQDFSAVAQLVQAEHDGRPVFALGESMGAAVIMTVLGAGGKPPVAGAILSAPAVWGRRTMSALQRGALEIMAHAFPMIRLRPQGLNIRPSDNTAMLKALGRDSRLIRETRIDSLYGLVGLMDDALEAAGHLQTPLLVLYGKKDEIIPVRATCLMLARIPGARSDRRWRSALYPEGYHMLFRDLARDVVIQDMAAWLRDAARPLPSGYGVAPDPETGNPLPGFCPDPVVAGE